MAATAILAIGTAYTIDSSEKAKTAQKQALREANAKENSIIAAKKKQETITANNQQRDEQRRRIEAGQAAANGRGSTILTSGLSDGSAVGLGSGIGGAMSTGGGKTLLGM